MGNDGFMQILQNNKRAAVKRHKGSAKNMVIYNVEKVLERRKRRSKCA